MHASDTKKERLPRWAWTVITDMSQCLALEHVLKGQVIAASPRRDLISAKKSGSGFTQ
jgi:hypothetical protein